MNLYDLADRMEQAITQDIIELSDETTFQTAQLSAILSALYQTTNLLLHITEFTKPTQEKEQICLSGSTILSREGEVSVVLLLSWADGKKDRVAAEMTIAASPEWPVPFGSGGDICTLLSVAEKIRFTEGCGDQSGELTGTLKLGNWELPSQGQFQWEKERWNVAAHLGKGESVPIRELLGFFFRALALPIPAEVFPDVSITQLTFGTASESPVAKYEMELSFSTDAGLMLTKYFGMKNLGAGLKVWDSYHEFSLTGSLVIGNTTVPLLLIYRNDMFILGADTRTGDCHLPSVADFCLLAGLDASEVFPEVFGDIMLHTLTGSAPASLDSLSGFAVKAYVRTDWKFFGIDSIVLRKVEVSCSCYLAGEDMQTAASVSGTIGICGTDVVVGGYRDADGWYLKAALDAGEELNLNSLISGLAELLFNQTIELPLPECVIKDTYVSFGLTKKDFHAETAMAAGGTKPEDIAGMLLNISADVKVDSTLENGKRSYAAELEGSLMLAEQQFRVYYSYDKSTGKNTLVASWENQAAVSPLSVVSLLHAVGVSGIPEFIECLELSLDKVELQYDFLQSVLNASVVSRHYGEISLMIKDSPGQKDYRAVVSLKEPVMLSNLPIVGNSLHILDGLALEEIKFYFSNLETSYGREKIQPGVAMTGKAVKVGFLMQISDWSQTEVMLTDSGQSTLVKWFSVEKDFSIFHFHRIGVGIVQGAAAFYLDASVRMNPLTVSMMGLGLSIPLANPEQIGFALQGMGIDVKKPDLEIAGTFLKSGKKDGDCYEGQVRIQVKNISIFAVGSYEDGALFVYAVISAPLGGPPVFFITGLAAGFGYNEDLICPSIDEIAKFPLVAGALGSMTQEEMAAELSEKIYPSKSRYFLAGGIKFTSFKMVESFAMLLIRFGTELEISLLGLSELNVPFDANKSSAIAHAQLALKASVLPSEGLFSVMAQLTSESYILSKSCILTGGFACYVWFGGEHRGDFVITLGGYHESYKKPAHYPEVPRVGFRWKVDDYITLSGDIYFALNPSAVMAGGKVEARFEAGPVKAWFIAKADFLIQWKPLFYDINIQIRLGASIRIDFLLIHHTFSLELGAGLHLWGPEFSGTAHITWFIISFTIHFGAGSSQKAPEIDWETFCTSFLPGRQQVQGRSTSGEHAVTGSTVQVTEGLLRVVNAGDLGDISIVRPENVIVFASSAIPAAKLTVNGCTVESIDTPLGVLPMGEQKELISHYDVNIVKIRGGTREENGGPSDHSEEKFVSKVYYENVPSAMWGLKKEGDTLIQNAATGIVLSPEELRYITFPENEYFNLLQLSIYAAIWREFSWNRPKERPKPYEQIETIKCFSETVEEEKTAKRRADFAADMAAAGLLQRVPSVKLEELGKRAADLFDEEIYLGGVL